MIDDQSPDPSQHEECSESQTIHGIEQSNSFNNDSEEDLIEDEEEAMPEQ